MSEKLENKFTRACFNYKCRQCGAIFSDPETTVCLESALIIICATINEYELTGVNPKSPGMFTTHGGCPKGAGVADLIGFEEI